MPKASVPAAAAAVYASSVVRIEELRLLIELGSDEQWIATVDEVILVAAALGTWDGGFDEAGILLRQLEASQDAFESFRIERQNKKHGRDKEIADQVQEMCK